MSTIHASRPELLKAVKKLEADELDAFIEQALSLRARSRATTLSATETRLLKRINQGMSEELCSRYEELARRRQKGTLTADEHTELLKLTHELESRDADRAAALWELAQLRRVPIRILMKHLGIKAKPIHG